MRVFSVTIDARDHVTSENGLLILLSIFVKQVALLRKCYPTLKAKAVIA